MGMVGIEELVGWFGEDERMDKEIVQVFLFNGFGGKVWDEEVEIGNGDKRGNKREDVGNR
ncbi:hypothetical protein [Bacillus velezensis]|uniref:hypothetical protein n=1 Tax=Bacillus velezensis TaxID=492670 RepID=UPI0011AB09C6|nr:hypothetical protein [Bacillus velezensis]